MKWVVYTDPRDHEVRFLAPASPVTVGSGSPEEQARAFFTTYKDALHATGAADEIELQSSMTDARGNVHIRFSHRLPGTTLPVFGAGSTAHFTADGSLYWLITDFREGLTKLPSSARVAESAAVATATAHASSQCKMTGAPASAVAQLGVRADPEAEPALVYRIALEPAGGDCIAPAVLVDATTGAPLALEERATSLEPTVGGSRFYRLNDFRDVKPISVTAAPAQPALFQMASDDENSTRVITHATSGAVITTSDPAHWDESSPAKGAAADGHYFTRQALAYLRSFAAGADAHGRAYVYPLALDVHATVHDNSEANSFGYNAYALFDGTRDTIHFGDGVSASAPNALPFSAAYDVVAHELTHLVTSHTSNLKYERESGALNESFSDVMGAAAEHAATPDDTRNYLVGEDLYIAGQPGPTALRSMTAPRSLGQPDHKDDFVACTGAPARNNDQCGVHSNSGIPNRAFSLMVQGGSVMKFTNGTAAGPRPVGVQTGMGWERATDIAYWAMTGLPSTANFEMAALAEMAESARYMVTDENVARATVCAWHAVGVLTSSPEFETLLGSTSCVPSTPPPPPGPPSPVSFCAGRPDGLICDPAQGYGAIACKNGVEDDHNTQECADHDLRCQTVSADDLTAQVDGQGIIICK